MKPAQLKAKDAGMKARYLPPSGRGKNKTQKLRFFGWMDFLGVSYFSFKGPFLHGEVISHFSSVSLKGDKIIQ